MCCNNGCDWQIQPYFGNCRVLLVAPVNKTTNSKNRFQGFLPIFGRGPDPDQFFFFLDCGTSELGRINSFFLLIYRVQTLVQNSKEKIFQIVGNNALFLKVFEFLKSDEKDWWPSYDVPFGRSLRGVGPVGCFWEKEMWYFYMGWKPFKNL